MTTSTCSVCAGKGHNKKKCEKKNNIVSSTKFYKKFVLLKKKFQKNDRNIRSLTSMYENDTRVSRNEILPLWLKKRSNFINNIQYRYYKKEWEILLKKKYDLCVQSQFNLELIQSFNILKKKIDFHVLQCIFEFLYEPKKKINYYKRNLFLKKKLEERGF